MADAGQRGRGANHDRGAGNHGGGGNRGPAFSEAEINNFLDIMGEVVPIGLIEWGIVVDRH
jgi:hypothetical protein